MKRFLFATFAATGVFAASMNLLAHPGEHGATGEAKTVTLKGELIDTACFVASDGDAKGSDHAECARKCLGSGIPAGILPEGSADASRLLFLLTNPRPLAAHAGKTIKVEGTVNEKLHAIDVKKVQVVEANGSMTEIKLEDEHHKMGGGEDAAKEDGHKEHKH